MDNQLHNTSRSILLLLVTFNPVLSRYWKVTERFLGLRSPLRLARALSSAAALACNPFSALTALWDVKQPRSSLYKAPSKVVYADILGRLHTRVKVEQSCHDIAFCSRKSYLVIFIPCSHRPSHI